MRSHRYCRASQDAARPSLASPSPGILLSVLASLSAELWRLTFKSGLSKKQRRAAEGAEVTAEITQAACKASFPSWFGVGHSAITQAIADLQPETPGARLYWLRILRRASIR